MEEARPQPLIDEETIRRRVAELAKEISDDYRDKGEILLIGVLRGAFIFLADLARRLEVPNRVDFIALASYEGSTTSGAVRLIMDVRANIENQHVLIVEDIVDTGHTLDYLRSSLSARRPASLKACVLTCKPDRLEVTPKIDYLGFEIPDAWVVGFGLDYADQYRTLPYIGVLEVPSE